MEAYFHHRIKKVILTIYVTIDLSQFANISILQIYLFDSLGEISFHRSMSGKLIETTGKYIVKEKPWQLFILYDQTSNFL